MFFLKKCVLQNLLEAKIKKLKQCIFEKKMNARIKNRGKDYLSLKKLKHISAKNKTKKIYIKSLKNTF